MQIQYKKTSEEWKQLLKVLISRLHLWNNELTLLAPNNALRRRRFECSPFIIVKCLLGLFLAPKRRSLIETKFILEGLRYSYYVENMDPSSVLVIGSWNEARHAKSLGFKFCWSFPIEFSVILSKLYGFNAFIDFHAFAWIKALKLGTKKFVLLYEDTQPLGCFFAALTRLSSLNSSCKTICIQHGYFSRLGSFSTIDGSFSEFNFVWDKASIKSIGCDPLKAFQIGPQFHQRSENPKLNKVIFVGPGSNYDGTDEFDITLNYYHKIVNHVHVELQAKATYRPHPCEISDNTVFRKLQSLFENIEIVSKEKILTRDRHIFVGTHSSLLFEACYCGHVVIILDICKCIMPSLEFEFRFRDGEEELAALEINRLLLSGAPSFKKYKLPQDSFSSAIDKVCLL